MPLSKRFLLFAVPVAVAASSALVSQSSHAEDPAADEIFPKGLKYLLPPPVPLLSDPDRSYADEQVAGG